MLYHADPPSLPPTIMIEAHQKAYLPGCGDIPGFAPADIDPDVRYVLFGEIYGTNEYPQYFGYAVCALSEHGPITVALEWPDTYTPELKVYLASPESAAADRRLLSLAIWARGSADGRSSAAMYRLVKLVKMLRTVGRKVDIAAFQPSGGEVRDRSGYERALSENLAQLSGPDHLVVALMGRLHASKSMLPSFPVPLKSAALNLPDAQVLSVRFESKGGQAWTCGDQCGPHVVGRAGGGDTLWSNYVRTIEGYDVRLFLNLTVTFSPPME